MRIRFDSGPSGVGSDFSVPTEIISAQTTTELSPALARLDKARRDGFWLAGYTSYELGYLLEPRLLPRLPKQRRLPLLRFGVYSPPRQTALATGTAQLSQFTPLWDRAAYEAAFAVVHGFIAAGDIYQANLTFPLQAITDSCSQSLYAALAAVQPVQYGALILQDGLPDILSRAPELFFRTDAQGNIQTRPMKGTQPRHSDPVKDRAHRDFLATDPKNRAENLMIVDLLRNDMARVCQPGSVKVPDLFKVETYTTLHQMTSLIKGQLKPDTTFSALFRALFPCGSITGAPKLRAMEILRDLEPWPRDIYCGAIGWAAPDGRSEFNVAIRSLMIEAGEVTLNAGGGVVWDSTAPEEYEEALWKTRFTNLPQTACA